MTEPGQGNVSGRDASGPLRAAGMHPLHGSPSSLMEPERGGCFDLANADKTGDGA